MSSPDDGRQTAPDGGRHPGEQPPATPGYGQPGFGPPAWDPAQYAQPQYAQPQYQQPAHGQQQWGQPGYGQAPYGPGYGAGPLRPADQLPGDPVAGAGLRLRAGRADHRHHRPAADPADRTRTATASRWPGSSSAASSTAFFVLLIVFWIIAFAAVTNDGFAP